MKVLWSWKPWKMICKDQPSKTRLQILARRLSRFFVKSTLEEDHQYLLLILYTSLLVLLIWLLLSLVQVLQHQLYYTLVYWTQTLSLSTRGSPCQLRCGWQPSFNPVEILPSLGHRWNCCTLFSYNGKV